jgi:hypothetical protein
MKNMIKTAAFVMVVGTFSLGAFAQTAQTTTAPGTIHQRKDNQQQRIGEGVENGSLTAHEAAKLEGKETKLNAEQQRMKAANGGTLTPAQRARLQRQQGRLSKQIYNQKHDAQAQNLNPTSEVGKRDRAQQQRIGVGIENGSLRPGEAAKVEHQETRQNREQANMRAANGGTLTPAERARVNQQQNRESQRIYNKKHNARVRR